MFDNHRFFCLHTQISLPLHSEWLQYCLGVCITSALLWDQISAFLWLIVLFFSFVLLLKAVGNIWLHRIYFSLPSKKNLCWSLKCYLFELMAKDEEDSFIWCDTTFLSEQMCLITLFLKAPPGILNMLLIRLSLCSSAHVWKRANCLMFVFLPPLSRSLSLFA